MDNLCRLFPFQPGDINLGCSGIGIGTDESHLSRTISSAHAVEEGEKVMTTADPGNDSSDRDAEDAAAHGHERFAHDLGSLGDAAGAAPPLEPAAADRHFAGDRGMLRSRNEWLPIAVVAVLILVGVGFGLWQPWSRPLPTEQANNQQVPVPASPNALEQKGQIAEVVRRTAGADVEALSESVGQIRDELAKEIDSTKSRLAATQESVSLLQRQAEAAAQERQALQAELAAIKASAGGISVQAEVEAYQNYPRPALKALKALPALRVQTPQSALPAR